MILTVSLLHLSEGMGNELMKSGGKERGDGERRAWNKGGEEKEWKRTRHGEDERKSKMSGLRKEEWGRRCETEWGVDQREKVMRMNKRWFQSIFFTLVYFTFTTVAPIHLFTTTTLSLFILSPPFEM